MDLGIQGIDEAIHSLARGSQEPINHTVPVGQGNKLNGEYVKLDRGAASLEAIVGVIVVARLEGIRGSTRRRIGKGMRPLGDLEMIVAIGSRGLWGLREC